MRLALILLLAACPKKEPAQPTPPRPIDAAIDSGPVQTPTTTNTIVAARYAQTCTRDDECVAVFEGDPCNPCRCAFNAIRKDALVKYKADLGQFWGCFKPDECKDKCRQNIGDAAKCDAGTCLLPP